MNIFNNDKTSAKPIKIFLKASTSKNNIDNPEEKKTNKENSPPSSNISINQILHETKLREIEILQQELKALENENESIEEQIVSEKESFTNLQEKYNKLNDKYNNETLQLNQLKQINTTKNLEYQQIYRIRQQQLNELNENNNNNNESNNSNRNNENNNHNGINNLEEVVTGINFLMNVARLRRSLEEDLDNSVVITENNNNEEGPPMTQEQLDNLPCTIYPRNNNNNEKCVICEFDFCFNDTIIILRCNHKFHKNCLINRLTARHSSKCPTCKESII